MSEKNKTKKFAGLLPPIQTYFHNVAVKVSKVGELTIAQYRALSIIAGTEGLAINDLKNRLGLAQSSTSGIVDRLEHGGLIRRLKSETDGRLTIIKLTPKAKRLFTSKAKIAEDVYGQLLTGLNSAEQDELINAFETIVKYINKYERNF